MPVTFSDNFDADAVGSTQTANWTNQGGTVASGTTTYTDAARPGGNIFYAVIAVH